MCRVKRKLQHVKHSVISREGKMKSYTQIYTHICNLKSVDWTYIKFMTVVSPQKEGKKTGLRNRTWQVLKLSLIFPFFKKRLPRGRKC